MFTWTLVVARVASLPVGPVQTRQTFADSVTSNLVQAAGSVVNGAAAVVSAVGGSLKSTGP
ncbi:MAG: hypothetical protein WCP29_13965 [Acidobacteriota bacterium]